MTTSDDDFIVPEIRIEECVNDVIEAMWEQITGDNDLIEEKIEDLAAHLGIPLEQDSKAMERYQELYGRIVRASWAGLAGKLGEELKELMRQDIEGDYA